MIDLALIKQHCRIEQDFTDDDALLTLYAGAAARYVETWTRRNLYGSETDDGYDIDADRLLLTDDVAAAMLLLIAHWYANRETATPDTLTPAPFAVEALLQPYRIYGV